MFSKSYLILRNELGQTKECQGWAISARLGMLHWPARDGKLPAIAAHQPRLTLCLAQCLVTVDSHCAAFHHLTWPLQSSLYELFLAFWGRCLLAHLTKELWLCLWHHHNSDWQMLFSSIRRADELSQGWLRHISQLYVSSCWEIVGQEFTRWAVHPFQEKRGSVHSFQEKRGPVHCPGRNSNVGGVLQSGLVMQTQLEDAAPDRPAADINVAQKKGSWTEMSDSGAPKEIMLSAKGQADPRDGRARQEVPFAGNAEFSLWGMGAGSCTPASSAASQVPPQMGALAGDSPCCSEQFPEPCGCCQGKEQCVKRGVVSSHWKETDNRM